MYANTCEYLAMTSNGFGQDWHVDFKRKENVSSSVCILGMNRLVVSPHWHACAAFEIVPVPLKSSCPKHLCMYANTCEYLTMIRDCLATSCECCRQKHIKDRDLLFYSLNKVTVSVAPLACLLCLWKCACAIEILLPKSFLAIRCLCVNIWQWKQFVLQCHGNAAAKSKDKTNRS